MNKNINQTHGQYKDVAARYGIGRSSAIALSKAAEARVKFGKLVLCDFSKIDQYLEQQQRQQAAK